MYWYKTVFDSLLVNIVYCFSRFVVLGNLARTSFSSGNFLPAFPLWDLTKKLRVRNFSTTDQCRTTDRINHQKGTLAKDERG